MAFGLRWLVLAVAISPLAAFAQPALPLLQPALHFVTPDAYREQLESMRDLIRACRGNASKCDAASVGDDDLVEAQDGSFQARWPWMRKLMDDARNPAMADRDRLLDQAWARLDEELAPDGAKPAPVPAFAPARRAADSVLARPEFRIVGTESWWDRQVAKFWEWFNRIFSAASEFGRHSPWLGPVLEWSFVGAAAVAVLIWVTRTMRRQRLAISLAGTAIAADWQKESANWADRASAEAERGNWREAIHCLYWASIVALESRRLWRRNYARTPREYLRLLEPNSPQKTALSSLTGIFERIWYGLRGAAQEDYTRALAIFEDLRGA